MQIIRNIGTAVWAPFCLIFMGTLQVLKAYTLIFVPIFVLGVVGYSIWTVVGGLLFGAQ